jgi:hypothetical protein
VNIFLAFLSIIDIFILRRLTVFEMIVDSHRESSVKQCPHESFTKASHFNNALQVIQHMNIIAGSYHDGEE